MLIHGQTYFYLSINNNILLLIYIWELKNKCKIILKKLIWVEYIIIVYTILNNIIPP